METTESVEYAQMKEERTITTKCGELINLLQQKENDVGFRAIVFVQTRDSARKLNDVLVQQARALSLHYIRPEVITGNLFVTTNKFGKFFEISKKLLKLFWCYQ